MLNTLSPHLIARGLHQTYNLSTTPLEILRGIDLEVMHGEKLFLCGASGAGKSTLLYTLSGMEHPVSGEIIFEGKELFKMKQDSLASFRNERMGFVFQSYFLLPELTALENVTLPALLSGKQAKEKASLLLERVGLSKRLNHLPSQLSGGEQQRVAIARALINDPGILFADEPTGNLDTHTGAVIIDLLLELADEGKRTLIAVTHDNILASRGDRRLLVIDGIIKTV